MTFDPTPIRLNQHVYRDTGFRHPQLGTEVGREFFDRTVETARALDALAGRTSRCVLIVGERRMGKTSLFRHLIERLKAAPGVVAAQLPPGGSLHSADDLFGEIVDQVAAMLPETGEDPPVFEPGLNAVAQLDALAALFAGQPGGTVVLCLDELDVCLEHQETPPAERARIAALIDGLGEREDLPVKLLCTMIRQPERLATGIAPDLLQRATLIHLPPFSGPDLDQMVAELASEHLGLELKAGDLASIYRASGGWPFFAKVLLVTLGESAPGARRLEHGCEQAAVHPAVTEAVAHIFRHYLDKNEKCFMIELARRQGRLTAGQAAELGAAGRSAADQLVKRFFVARDPNGGYEFRIGLLAAWFQQWSKFQELAETYTFAS